VFFQCGRLQTRSSRLDGGDAREIATVGKPDRYVQIELRNNALIRLAEK
jgi:hypothetical protein